MSNPEPALESTRTKIIEDEPRATFLLSAERRTLEMIASGARLNDILEDLCDTINAQAPGIRRNRGPALGNSNRSVARAAGEEDGESRE